MVDADARQRARLDTATASLDPPFAIVDVAAFDANAADLVRRARGVPIRVASKSLRCRWAIDRALAGGDSGVGPPVHDGDTEASRPPAASTTGSASAEASSAPATAGSAPATAGVMAFTLPEALWLAGLGYHDVLVAYPSVDRGALAALAGDERLLDAITLMVDHTDHLDVIDAALPPSERAGEVRICLEVDASLRLFDGRVHLGVRRSPVHTPEQARRLAEAVVGRPGVRLDGVMLYEAQVAGIGDAPSTGRWRTPAIRAVRSASLRDLAVRRPAVVAAVGELADLRFVNGGGTGSIGSTVDDPVVTEVTAGSGYYAPALFDDYRGFQPIPAAMFALPVVRRPAPGVATLLGGGYLASGPGGNDRLPHVHLPFGLRLTATEGAGEVQTPVVGPAADHLRVGDRVWLRHVKAGELCERFDALHLIDGDRVVGTVPTYRGEGACWL